MRRRNRLGSSSLIRRVYAEGTRVRVRGLVCTTLLEGSAEPRVAVVASRKVGGAVERNRARRRIRAAADPLVGALKPGALVVVAARGDSLSMDFQKLADSVRAGLARSGAATVDA